MKPLIRLSSGIIFNILDPPPDLIKIEDIARALSQLCRFTGHTRKFYSVAEHSVRVSKMVPEEDALWGLLHDATEAYVGDISMPLKRQEELFGFNAVEAKLSIAVAKAFNLPLLSPVSVKEADREVCRQEGASLIRGWDDRPHMPTFLPIKCWKPDTARRLFLARYEQLTRPPRKPREGQ